MFICCVGACMTTAEATFRLHLEFENYYVVQMHR